MTGEELLTGLHDGRVESLRYDWQNRVLELGLLGAAGAITLTARGVTKVAWSNEAPWGSSKIVSINEVDVRVAFGFDVVEVEFTTGDRMLVEAKEIVASRG